MKKVIVITGAGKGIGKAIALDFAKATRTKNGFDPVLILVSRTLKDLESVAQECRRYGATAEAIEADIADTTAGRDMAALVTPENPYIKGLSIRGQWMSEPKTVEADGGDAVTADDLDKVIEPIKANR